MGMFNALICNGIRKVWREGCNKSIKYWWYVFTELNYIFKDVSNCMPLKETCIIKY